MNLIKTLQKNRTLLLYGGIVLVGGLIIFALSRGGSGGTQTIVSGGPSEGLQAEQIAANAQLSAIQFEGQLTAQLATQQLQAEIALATIGAAANSETLSAQLAGLQSELSAQQNLASLDAGLRRDEIQSNERLQGQALQANFAMFDAQLASNNFITQTQNETIRFQTQAQTEQFLALTNLQNVQAMADRDVDIFRINSDVERDRIQAITDRQGIEAQRRIERTRGRQGLIGGLIGGLFSDVRLKDNIKTIGEHPAGYPLYEYSMKGERHTGLHVGVMAQDLLTMNPDIVHQHGNYLAVDYGAL